MDSFLAANIEKLAYIKLNRQTPCPPRGAVPVNTRRLWEALSLQPRLAFGHGGDRLSYVGVKAKSIPTPLAISKSEGAICGIKGSTNGIERQPWRSAAAAQFGRVRVLGQASLSAYGVKPVG
jgi:hypothetical protein